MISHAQEAFQNFQNQLNNNITKFEDQYISEEEEDYCPLCIEPLDITDKNFFPCPCGYQICQFCYNNIRQNPELNGRCPACRRKYDDENVRYVVLSPEELKLERAKQAKKEKERKLREKERKENEYNNRKHLAGMRVIQKNLVYVVGINPPVPYEEVANTLKSDKYFGQYGKINKIVVNKKTPHGDNDNSSTSTYHHRSPGYGVYITYASKDDAAKCITQVDGTYMDGRLIKAAYGTTKYCSSYLRGLPCPNPNCMFLHEPGEEADSFNRRELHNKQQQQLQQQQQQQIGHGTPSSAHSNIYTKHLPNSSHTFSSLNSHHSATTSPAPIRTQLNSHESHNNTGHPTPSLTPAPVPAGSNPWGITQSSTPVTSLNLSKNTSSNHLPSLSDTHNSNIPNTTTATSPIESTSHHNKKKNATNEKQYCDPYDSLNIAVKFLDERITELSNYENKRTKLRSNIIDESQYKNYPSLFSWDNIEPSEKSDNVLSKKLVEILSIKPIDYSASVVEFLQSVNVNNGTDRQDDNSIQEQQQQQVISEQQTPVAHANLPPGIFPQQFTQPQTKTEPLPSNSSDLLNQLINGRRVVAGN
ncbi:hypothetical protein KAFR_0L00960 [Kazachstania africana CBS 2517]|uniref:RING-type domain-containing protein n=1 Tax=Kazachstania africana (strain ATCC 22294 / BCRC 22015 / CBS 2517 / CECT 1963 / NBRC 1671 / NRRL Y-8276) TaxID=1071382 RepID=H2B254_KAZAF|nr:hypothetical protein KAFR_0L00960 [Kazachstania africana CBS 2517]CCF60704.1 hypothetical protein KAFR_0L00960 [Kazachstania africana CBS 2517]